MISVLGWLLGLLAIIVLVPVSVLLLQVLLACLPAAVQAQGHWRAPASGGVGARPR